MLVLALCLVKSSDDDVVLNEARCSRSTANTSSLKDEGKYNSAAEDKIDTKG